MTSPEAEQEPMDTENRKAGNGRKAIVIDERGRLELPPDISDRFGLKPGARIFFEEGKNAILLHRPISRLARVYIEPTTRCNLNCRTCIRNVWDEPLRDMAWNTFERIVEDLRSCRPVPAVTFGGFGEPLLHPDILQMIETFKLLGSDVTLITNGTLLDKERIHRLHNIGLDMLWVSLDGATPESYTEIRRDNLLPVIIDHLKDINTLKHSKNTETPHLGIVFVATDSNLDDMIAVFELGAWLGVKKFFVTNMLPYTEEMKNDILYGESMWNFKNYLTGISMPRMDASPRIFDVLKAFLSRYEWTNFINLDFSRPYDTCPFVERGSTSVRWDGMVSPCLPLLHSHSSYLGERWRHSHAFHVGSLVEEGLIPLWKNAEYARFRENLTEFSFSPCTKCRSCEMSESNLQDCFGNQFPTCGGCLWAQGFVQCP